jgi:hypothetical protein
MVKNQEYIIEKSELKEIERLPELLDAEFGPQILRWFISKVTEDDIQVEITLFEETEGDSSKGAIETLYPDKSVVLSVIPTGIGCTIGGFAADAAPATAVLASACDYLITNPNAVNGSNFIFKADNVLYTEGFIIDQFCKGLVNLYRPYANKVGLIINKPNRRELEIVFNIINAVRAVHGIDIEDYVITDESIGGSSVRSKSGAYVGNIERPEVLFKACNQLIERGVSAIAVTSNIEDLPLPDYAEHFDGNHPNPIGGAEALISHLICRRYRLPAAHAPLLNVKDLNLKSKVVDARGAGEFSSTCGLACVLIGLCHAPQIEKTGNYRIKDVINIHNVLAVVAPASALGGIPMLYARKHGIPVIAVRENETILEVTGSRLNLKNVCEVSNYAEAAGVVLALKRGIALTSLRRPLSTIRF